MRYRLIRWHELAREPWRSLVMGIGLGLMVLALTGCPPVTADAIKACGETCKDNGGVISVTGEHCYCKGR